MIPILQVLLHLLIELSTPPMTARWDRPNTARIVWTQPNAVTETCFHRQPMDGQSVLITCLYNVPSGPNTLFLGNKGPLNASYRPQGGDTFVIVFDNAATISAPLRSVSYLPAFRGGSPP